jgi:hypothetical protein
MSDVPANRPDAAFDFSSHPDSAYLQSQLNAVLPDAKQGGSSLPRNSPHRAQFSTLPSSKRKSNQARNHQKQSNFSPNGVGSEAQRNTSLDGKLYIFILLRRKDKRALFSRHEMLTSFCVA